jgi:hypothetical protein
LKKLINLLYSPQGVKRMASKAPLPPPEFDDLSADDENEDEQALWEYITAGPDKEPGPQWHLDLLREREARYERDGVEWTTWEEFEKELDEILNNG